MANNKFKDGFDTLLYYIENHLVGMFFIATFVVGLIRAIAYLIESIRRCFIK